MDDRQLLRQFAKHNSQEAFAVLTTRYLNLVYSVCHRELDNDTLAEDVTQAVFLILARKAPTLRREVILSGWLFQTARFAARNARTQEQRRESYEQKAAEAMRHSSETEDPAWAEIEPLLNQSLASLREAERECVLLRFFQDQSFTEVGTALGLSEEAARKRVTRALEKMRLFLTKNGVIVPSVVLAALLPIHAAKAAPAFLAGNITQTLAGSLPGPASLIAQGVLHTMKIWKLKMAAGAVALALAGAATYVLANTVSAHPPTATEVSLDDPITVIKSDATEPGKKDVVRNVIFSGKVRYEDGRPAGGIPIAAQIQNTALMKQFDARIKQAGVPNGQSIEIQSTKKDQEESWNNAVSKPDGTYEMPVGANIPYNVMVFDETGKWVAAAVEGASGTQNTKVELPDLILTKGSLVIGKVTTSAGIPVPHVMVASYGPDRPATSAASGVAPTDLSGFYRMRVVPGKNRIYIGGGPSKMENQTLEIKSGQIVTANFQTNLLSAL